MVRKHLILQAGEEVVAVVASAMATCRNIGMVELLLSGRRADKTICNKTKSMIPNPTSSVRRVEMGIGVCNFPTDCRDSDPSQRFPTTKNFSNATLQDRAHGTILHE